MSLRWRLILSYIIIIVVSLLLTFTTLLIIARPIQSRLLSARLATQSRQAAFWVNALYRQQAPLERIATRLATWGQQNNTRVLLIAKGRVLVDSRGLWQGQQIELPPQPNGLTAQTGSLNAPNGDTLLYAAVPVGPPEARSTGHLVTIAPAVPTLSRLVAELGWPFTMAGLIALLISVLLGVLIARSIALPLQDIAAAAGAVAKGDYNHRLPETGPPEIKRVATSFNVMVEQVKNHQQAMRDLVSNVSHELKTPLTSIQGFSQAIMEGATSGEASRSQAAGIIHQEASRMARLVNDLLDLAQLDSGQAGLRQEPLDLAQILTSTVDRLLPQAAARQVKLARQWDTLPPLRGDGDRLAQVFTNLLDNAIHHTPAGERVIIAGRPQQDFVEISVTDTGPGIPPEELPRLFERFYQVDKSRKRSRGTGLGLAISREIVEMHGGRIQAESVEGLGTKFTVFLPVAGG